MAQMVSKETYNVSKDILLAPHLAFTISAIVGSTGVTNNAEGRKVIPAGTPVGGTTSVLATRSTVLQVTNTSSNGANAQGVVLHDVDVTAGTANHQAVIFGFIDTRKLESSVVSALTQPIRASLTKITFVK